MLDLVFKNYTSQKSPGEKFFREILNTGIRELKLKDKNVEVSLNLVGEAKIRELNKKYRGKDKVTDVLSFPLEEDKMVQYGILPLGDIFICFSVAETQAAEEKISIEKKLAHLTIHGLLHLSGLDHERSKNEADRMFSLEQKILDNYNF